MNAKVKEIIINKCKKLNDGIENNKCFIRKYKWGYDIKVPYYKIQDSFMWVEINGGKHKIRRIHIWHNNICFLPESIGGNNNFYIDIDKFESFEIISCHKGNNITTKTFKVEEGMFEHTFNEGVKRMKWKKLVEKEEIIDNGDNYVHEVIFNTPVNFKLYLDKALNHPADVEIQQVKYACFYRLSETMIFNKNKINKKDNENYINTRNFDNILFTL